MAKVQNYSFSWSCFAKKLHTINVFCPFASFWPIKSPPLAWFAKQGLGFSVGFLDALGYNHEQYFRAHPQLSVELIDALLDRGISIIGLDFAGVRHDPAHTPMDQHCADHGVFIVENLCGFQQILKGNDHALFTANTYPVRARGITGLPCRVIASV